MNPADTLHQMSLLSSRLSQPLYASYMDFFQATSHGQPKHEINIMDAQGKPSGWHFCERERKRLTMAEAYVVSPEMTALVQWSAKSLDESDTFRHDLWPSDYGFVWLPEPFIGTEARGRKMTTKAITWGRVTAQGRSGTYVVFYSDTEDPRDEVSVQIVDQATPGERESMRKVGRLQVSHMTFFQDGREVGPAQISPIEGVNCLTSEPAGPFAALPMAETSDNFARHVLALLMLLNQTVASVHKEPVDKATTKRMRRMGLPGEVTVVQLRRCEGNPSQGESEVEWRHRWLVKGHWRWQAYGRPVADHSHEMGEVFSESGRLVRLCLTAGCDRHWERIYVAPFVKGPENMPFKVSTKVYSLSR